MALAALLLVTAPYENHAAPLRPPHLKLLGSALLRPEVLTQMGEAGAREGPMGFGAAEAPRRGTRRRAVRCGLSGEQQDTSAAQPDRPLAIAASRPSFLPSG